MRQLTNMEVNTVSGGICEGMSIAECIDGSVSQAMEELGILWGGITRIELVQMLNEFGGDLGVWLYNNTHADEFEAM